MYQLILDYFLYLVHVHYVWKQLFVVQFLDNHNSPLIVSKDKFQYFFCTFLSIHNFLYPEEPSVSRVMKTSSVGVEDALPK